MKHSVGHVRESKKNRKNFCCAEGARPYNAGLWRGKELRARKRIASERLKVTFRGMVQGVGFRYTTYEVGKRHEVAGYVKNMRDGSVEVVAEGEREELCAFRAAILAKMGEYVHSQKEEWGPATGEFTGFTVAF